MSYIKRIFVIGISLFTIINATAQSNISISTVLTNPKCNGGTTGAIVATASGGTAPYQYQLSEAGAGGWQSGNSFTALRAGTYPVSVKDAINNVKTIYVTLTDPSNITATVLSNSASCSKSYDASVKVNVNGGMTPYSYSWTLNSTPINASNESSLHVSGSSTAQLTGPAGSYTVAVADKNGCSGAVTYYNPMPIALNSNSFNQDVIVEKTASQVSTTGKSPSITSKLDNDANGYVLFESGFKTSSAGLPSNGKITSLQDNTLSYNLNAYTSNNSSRTVSGGVSTLNLSTPTALAKILILGTSGNGLSSYSYSINFADSTTYSGTAASNTTSFRDWYASSGPDIAADSLSRIILGGSSVDDGFHYALFQSPIIIPAPYYNKPIASIVLTNTSTNKAAAGNIFALAGYLATGTASIVGYAEAGSSQPTVTINSNLDSTTNYYCNDQSVTYTANTIHGGSTPTYVWQYSTDNSHWTSSTNNTNTYTANPSTANYYVRVTATASSDAGCLANTTSDLMYFTSTKSTAITPSLAISGSTNICQGSNANYVINTKTNGGSAPTYTWLLDGYVNSELGTGPTANTSSLVGGTHSIQARMSSSLTCATNNPATSNAVSTIVNDSPVPTISISNINGKIPITFAIADSSNLGITPSYQWYLNGVSIANANTSKYTTTTTTVSGDNYSLKVSSSAACANPATLMSNYRTIATALPIILKSFVATAYSNNITLNWQTAAEINTDKFEILRKYQDSSVFVIVGIVKATNNPNGSSYQFVDYPAISGNYQYRLKNIDFDGNSQLSDIQSIYFGQSNGTLENKIYPNPFKDKFVINIHSNQMQSGNVLLYNMEGALVNTRKIQLINGYKTIEINNLGYLPSGIYIVKVTDQFNTAIVTFKTIKL